MDIKKSQVLDALNQAGLDDDALYEGYSGRGMYGHETWGVVTSSRDQLKVFAALAAFAAHADDDEADAYDIAEVASELADAASFDSMGYDQIMYFPRVELIED